MRILTMFLVAFLFAVPVFADVAVDPCEGMNAGDACTTDDGADGTCADAGEGFLECGVAPANNNTNGANNATTGNNASTGGNNATGETGGGETAAAKEEDKGCATVGGGSMLPSLLVFAMLFGLRRRR